MLRSKIDELQRAKQKVNASSNLQESVEKEKMEFDRLQMEYKESSQRKLLADKYVESICTDKKDIQANLDFRDLKRKWKAKEAELKELKKEINEIAPNSDNIVQEMDDIQIKIASERSKMDQTKGFLQSEKQKAVNIMHEAKSAKYKDIHELYRQQLIKHQTALIAVKDLDKFEKALDKSLIEFHSLKMEQINAVLKELWQQTYRGKDIDYIEIRSEIGGKTASGAARKRKTYNYNVVMHVGNEHDLIIPMRGRCSAGQRVLASLLIRLALAETFCSNCGILALDEPTTNLDSKNIEALAYALNQIVTRRKRQENFQLILITHDEQFVEKLGQREHTDGYYRVFKNQFQHSKCKLYSFHDGPIDHNAKEIEKYRQEKAEEERKKKEEQRLRRSTRNRNRNRK